MNPKLRITGIALTMFDSTTKLSNEVVAELERFIIDARGRNLPWSDAVIFETRIRRNIKLAESPSFGQTVIHYDPRSAGANDYRKLAREVMAMPTLAAAAPAAPQKVEVTVNRDINPATLAAAKSSDGEVAA